MLRVGERKSPISYISDYNIQSSNYQSPFQILFAYPNPQTLAALVDT